MKTPKRKSNGSMLRDVSMSELRRMIRATEQAVGSDSKSVIVMKRELDRRCKKPKQPKKRPMYGERGRNWHAWAWQNDAGEFFWYALGEKPPGGMIPPSNVTGCVIRPVKGGQWVRVRFEAARRI